MLALLSRLSNYKGNMDTSRHISIPNDLLQPADDFASLLATASLLINVGDDYGDWVQDKALPEVIAIQRLITLARNGVKLRVRWSKRIADQVFNSPSLFPLLAVVLCLDDTDHEIIAENGICVAVDVQPCRKAIYAYRPLSDLFSDTQVIICADSRGYGRPKALYTTGGNLISRTDFDAFVERLLTSQIGGNVGESHTVTFSQNVATIVAELFENTDFHGKKDIHGVPFKSNGLRGMMFKRIELSSRPRRPLSARVTPTRLSMQEHENAPTLAALEISVFDSGVGYYASYMRQPLNPITPLVDEWRVVHKCLGRHYEVITPPNQLLPDIRAGHTGMGLYEVLRALQFLKGKFEVRSGRTYGFRTFLEGETQFLNESADSITRPGMPKPVLLDKGLQFVRIPTPNELLVGSTVRVLIPLN